MLVTSIFSFSFNVFKSPLFQGRQKSGLCGKELIYEMHKKQYINVCNNEIIPQKTKRVDGWVIRSRKQCVV